MSTILIADDELEKFIDKAVQERLRLTIFQDMEAFRRSPAAAIVQLEDKIDLMVSRYEFNEVVRKLEARISKLEAKA